MSKPLIVIIGSLNMDFVVRVPHLPGPGETTLGSHFEMIPGGKGGNQACAVARIGSGIVDARMIGRVGKDPFADHLKSSLAESGVDVSTIQTSGTEPSGVALIWVDEAGQNSIVVAPGANSSFTEADVESFRPVLTGAQYVLFQLETPLPVVRRALMLARELGVRTILDPAPAQQLDDELLAHVDILTPNESEAHALLGRSATRVQPEEARHVAETLLKRRPGAVVLKLGERGSYYLDGAQELRTPAFEVAARDSTAAGDTFNGALAVALAEGTSLSGALRFASAASAICVSRPGAQSSIPTRSEVDEFLRSRAS